MLIVSRRLALLLALMFWQGGFIFYSGVVVPVGAAILGSDTDQRFITRSVTNYLNITGAAALAVWVWDLAAGPKGGRTLRWAVRGFLALTLGVMAIIHIQMDSLLDTESARVLDRKAFRALYRWYLGTSSIQWVGAILLTGATIRAWRVMDAARIGDDCLADSPMRRPGAS